ncbi:MAG: NADP-dependent oxidoreductase [Gammaproteobacteria bacterium]|nr:NADP-dependent oxidoreductase [Gammaproteobacteria bacterium]
MENQQVLIERLPSGKLQAEDYRLADAPMPEAGAGQVLIKTLAFAITAGTRAGLQGSASYAGAPSAGRVMNGSGVGEVVASNAPNIAVGDRVTAATGWQQYAAMDAEHVTVIDPAHDPIHYLGPMGVNGLTAYFGLLDVSNPQAGETVMVSAAAGSVGHMVGQMAKIRGCEVVGVCGSDDKGRLLVEQLGFDRSVNYKDANYRQNLKEATPNGVDVYFDNTGGMILGSALFRMNVGGRISCCGVVSQYDTNTPEPGPKGVPGLLVNNRLTMRGFLLFDYAERYAEAREDIYSWLNSGQLTSLQDEVVGLAAAPNAFVDLLSGGNVGTRIVRLDQ